MPCRCRCRWRTAAHDVVGGFATVGVARKNQFAFGVLRGGVESLRRCDLLRSQAVRGIAGLALQDGGIELARHRVRNKVVLHAVERIAGVHDRLGEHVLLRLGNESFRILEDIDHARHVAGVEVEMIVRGRAGDDGVEVFGIALRGHQSLTASCRATVVVGKTRALIVERFDESLRLHGHFVHGAIGEVDHLFGMTESEQPVGVPRCPVSFPAVA